MVILEVRIDIPRPIELVYQVIEIVVSCRGHVLDQERPGHRPAFHQRLVHAEDVRAPLWLVSHQRAWCMENTRRHQPAGAGLQAVALAVVQDAVVPLVPALQAAADVDLGRAWLQAKEGIGEIVTDRVELRWKIVGLRLALLAHQVRLGVVLMHVMRNRSEIIEELAVDRPTFEALPDILADQARAFLGHGIAQRERPLAFDDDIAQALVRRGAFVRRGRGRGEPAFVDAAALGAERVEILRSQLDAPAGHEEGTRHPGGRQPQNPFACLDGPLDGVGDGWVRNGWPGRLLGGPSFLRHGGRTPRCRIRAR